MKSFHYLEISPMSQNGCVLVVEDDAKNIDVLLKLLDGYDVLVATDGVQALEVLKQEPVDLVLMDILMPGMDGFQVCERIKAQDDLSHIPVIFLTSKTETADVVKGFDVGGVDYVTKPFKVPELLARIRTHVALKKAREELKSLRGILPICASCKKIRDDKGYWNQIEAYISQHSEADFSHGICPECARKLYADLNLDD